MKKRTVTSFTEEEYKQWAQNKNFQGIANVVSGFKPTANKVLYTLLKDNITSFMKVEALSSVTSIKTEYLGGASNIDGVIVNMVKNYTGSNNLTLLDKDGDFGARHVNAAAAGRYIRTKKSKNFEELFNKVDMNILPQYNLEGSDIEYNFLTFNLPMLLINGSEGMGSGHSHNILGRNPDEVQEFLINKLKGSKDRFNLKPWFRGFTGTVEQGDTDKQWLIRGNFETTSKTRTKITEVPVGYNYKSYIKKLDAAEDKGIIKGYEDLCDPKKDTFEIIIKHDSKFANLTDEYKIWYLGLQSKISENFTVIDENNKVKVHESADDVFNHYFRVKMNYMQLRKDYIIKKLNEDISFAESRYNYIIKVIDEKIVLKNKTKKQINTQISKFDDIIMKEDSYNYLINMPMHSVSTDTLRELKNKIREFKSELAKTKKITLENMWLNDLKD